MEIDYNAILHHLGLIHLGINYKVQIHARNAVQMYYVGALID